MLKFKNNTVLYMLLIICICAISGCNSSKDKDTDVLGIIENTTENITDEIQEEPTEDVTEPTEATDTLEVTEEPTKSGISIHVINDDSLQSEEKIVDIDENVELTPQMLVDKVVNEITNVSVIGIDYVKTEDSVVIVSFQSGKPPTQNVGSSVEMAILDSIANTLMNNLDYCQEVVFRLEGKPYASGHIELELNEAYIPSE